LFNCVEYHGGEGWRVKVIWPWAREIEFYIGVGEGRHTSPVIEKPSGALAGMLMGKVTLHNFP
jgi:hypothetical protein